MRSFAQYNQLDEGLPAPIGLYPTRQTALDRTRHSTLPLEAGSGYTIDTGTRYE